MAEAAPPPGPSRASGTSGTSGTTGGTRRASGPLAGAGRLLASEVALVLGRWRNRAVLAVLALVPVLVGVAVRVQGAGRSTGGGGGGPAFLASVTDNGIFLAFTALVVCLPVFLPLAVAVVAGESVAGEAATGTLRYLLVVPVGRTRLLAVKLAAAVLHALLAALVVAAAGVLAGLVLFPVGDVVLLSGTAVPYGEGLLRLLGVVVWAGLCLSVVAALGLLASTLTEVPVAAMAATVVVVVVVEVVDVVPQLAAVHPWLFTHDWFAFGDLLRDPVTWGGLAHGAAVQVAWAAVLASLAWARLTTRDVTS